MSNGVTTITLDVNLESVEKLQTGDRPWAIMANQHDAVDVYVVRRIMLPTGEVRATVHPFAINGDWLILTVAEKP